VPSRSTSERPMIEVTGHAGRPRRLTSASMSGSDPDGIEAEQQQPLRWQHRMPRAHAGQRRRPVAEQVRHPHRVQDARLGRGRVLRSTSPSKYSRPTSGWWRSSPATTPRVIVQSPPRSSGPRPAATVWATRPATRAATVTTRSRSAAAGRGRGTGTASAAGHRHRPGPARCQAAARPDRRGCIGAFSWPIPWVPALDGTPMSVNRVILPPLPRIAVPHPSLVPYAALGAPPCLTPPAPSRAPGGAHAGQVQGDAQQTCR
jgi:hypothetical protein